MLRFHSTPVGTEVSVAEEALPRGSTPFSFSLPQSKIPTRVTLRAKGHQDKVLVVTPDSDLRLDIALTPTPAARPPAPPRRTRPAPRIRAPDLVRGDVADPFSRAPR